MPSAALGDTVSAVTAGHYSCDPFEMPREGFRFIDGSRSMAFCFRATQSASASF